VSIFREATVGSRELVGGERKMTHNSPIFGSERHLEDMRLGAGNKVIEGNTSNGGGPTLKGAEKITKIKRKEGYWSPKPFILCWGRVEV